MHQPTPLGKKSYVPHYYFIECKGVKYYHQCRDLQPSTCHACYLLTEKAQKQNGLELLIPLFFFLCFLVLIFVVAWFLGALGCTPTICS